MTQTKQDNSVTESQALGSHLQKKKGGIAQLMLGALGVVYGDIGTSPLYAIKECFVGAHPLALDELHIFGILSLIFWALMIIVSLKYAALIMKADNRGEGGSLALLTLLGRLTHGKNAGAILIALGIFATSLFYGDSMLTPAISVLSAVEGLDVAVPGLGEYIIPITVAILIALFAVQRYGTGKIGGIFGTVIIVWFASLAVIGLANIAKSPSILFALNPTYAFDFFLADGWTAFLALGSVFLAVTGAEALYADMGHFGAPAIRRAWFGFALPALLLNYFGQGALLLFDPAAVDNPFYRSVPEWALLPMIILATLATVIASQAVISGAFSVTRQAMQLGFLPRLATTHTSDTESGQIYLPFINWTLLIAIVWLVIGFGSSSNLAAAYGVAVVGTMLISTVLFSIVAIKIWRWNSALVIPLVIGLLLIDLCFFGATITKIAHGGWFPLVVGVAIFTVMTTWKRGRDLLFACLKKDATPIDTLLNSISGSVTRVPGTAVFLMATSEGVPNSLLHNMKHNRIIHERVVFLTVITEDVAHTLDTERFTIQHLGRRFYRVILRYGYNDATDIPKALKMGKDEGLEIDEMTTSYFLGRETLVPSARPGMALWREGLFVWMSRMATTAMDFFMLPTDRVVELGTQVEI